MSVHLKEIQGSQTAWMRAPGVDGFPAFRVACEVENFSGYGMGSYNFFNRGLNIYSANAFEVSTSLPAGSLDDLLTIFLDKVHGKGGILNVANDTGGSSTVANPDAVVGVVSYPSAEPDGQDPGMTYPPDLL